MNKFSLANRRILKNLFFIARFNNFEFKWQTLKTYNSYNSPRTNAFYLLILHTQFYTPSTKMKDLCYISGCNYANLRFFGLHRLAIKKQIYNLHYSSIFVAVW